LERQLAINQRFKDKEMDKQGVVCLTIDA